MAQSDRNPIPSIRNNHVVIKTFDSSFEDIYANTSNLRSIEEEEGIMSRRQRSASEPPPPLSGGSFRHNPAPPIMEGDIFKEGFAAFINKDFTPSKSQSQAKQASGQRRRSVAAELDYIHFQPHNKLVPERNPDRESHLYETIDNYGGPPNPPMAHGGSLGRPRAHAEIDRDGYCYAGGPGRVNRSQSTN